MMDSPCRICLKKISKKQKSLICYICKKCTHFKCNNTNKDQTQDDKYFCCTNCLHESIPFSGLNNNEFAAISSSTDLHHSNERTTTPTDYQRHMYNKISTAMNAYKINHSMMDESGEDENCPPAMECKYYSPEEFTTAKFISFKTFSILHYNIHSVQRHIDEFRVVLDMLNFKFDVICLSESLIKTPQTPININIEGYQNPIGTPTDSAKGGVLIYVKSGIDFKCRNDLKVHKSKELESFFIEIKNQKEKNDIIGVIYRHPCMPGDEFNENHLKDLTDKLSKENKKVYIAGDFNYDLLDVSSHNTTFDFFDTMMSNFLLPTITLPTKINRINNTLIDNIFTNQIHPEMVTGNLTINLSDGHLPSFLMIPRQNQIHLPKKHNMYTRNLKKLDHEKFILDYHDINWDEVIDIENNDPNTAMENFLQTFNKLLDKHTPLKKLSQKQFKQKYKPWISNEILDKIKKKNNLIKKIVKCKNPEQKESLTSEFKSLKNEVTDLTRSSKKTYYQDYFTKHKNNLPKIWKGIKSIINISTKNHEQPTCIQTGVKTITNLTDISNSFNDYFTSIADEILRKRQYNGKKSYEDFLPERTQDEFKFEDFSDKEISQIISSLKSGKSYGPNSIPTQILQLLKNDICTPLAKIFNHSFKSGIHPDILKIAETIPIHKKGSRSLVGNYRPISLLSNLNKIFEKLVHTRIYKFLEDGQFLHSRQFGFRKLHSTNHALIDITEKIRNALDNKKHACGVFVDLQKAFDTVNHNILTAKLDHYGIRGFANNWFTSYLEDRSQYVSILGFKSKTKTIKHGVPQGSVLGPLLFLIYINDLHRAIKNSEVYHFADDTNLLNISDSLKTIKKSVNADLKALYSWLIANKISLNCDKTEIIFFHRPGGIVPDLKIKMNGSRLFPARNIKYLGAYLDETLNGRFHCDTLAKTLNRANGMLSRARHYINSTNLKSLYHAIFSSHLTYSLQVWGQSQNTHNKNIFKLQNRAIRTISFSGYQDDCNPLYTSLNILKLEDHRKLLNCLLVHDSLNNENTNQAPNLLQTGNGKPTC